MLLVHFQAEISALFTHSMQNISQLIKLHCKMIEPDMQKTWLILLVQKIDLTKFQWGNLGASPHNFLAVAAIAPMESAPMTYIQHPMCTCGAVFSSALILLVDALFEIMRLAVSVPHSASEVTAVSAVITLSLDRLIQIHVCSIVAYPVF